MLILLIMVASFTAGGQRQETFSAVIASTFAQAGLEAIQNKSTIYFAWNTFLIRATNPMPYPSISVVRSYAWMTLVRGMPWVLGGLNDPSDQTSQVSKQNTIK